MSALGSLESKIAGLVEGTFARAFKSEVRPIEIARKLVREMDQHKVQSLSRVFAPNEYVVWLSPRDRKHFMAYEDELCQELCGYLLEYSRSERLDLVGRPVVKFNTDEELRLGEFGIQARLVRVPAQEQKKGRRDQHGSVEGQHANSPQGSRNRPSGLPASQPGPVHSGLPSVDQPSSRPLGAQRLQPREHASNPRVSRRPDHARPHSSERANQDVIQTRMDRRSPVPPSDAQTVHQRVKPARVTFGGRTSEITGSAVLGRSRACEVVIDDPNVSRRHAEIQRVGSQWVLRDLDSTNGVTVNGQPIYEQYPLNSGDAIELGSARVTFDY